MRRTKFITTIFFLVSLLFSQDLTGVKICLDPGHGGYESDDRHMVETGFWESESNLTKGLFLKEILESFGADVIITRTGNNGTTDDPSLSERIGLANSNSADYFISIHSNAFDASSNYSMSIFNGKTASPRIPESKVMSEILCVEVMSADRTNDAVSVGDLTLNPTWTTGYGVLYPATMPANISEGSFHDYIPECWRLQSIDYRRQESWGLARAIVKYFEVGEISQKMISGIVRSIDETIEGYAIPETLDKYVTLNNATIKLIAETNPNDTIVYATDEMNNGFYTFDSLESGNYTLIATAKNYEADTISIEVLEENFNFADFNLISKIPPQVRTSYPVENQQNFGILEKIELTFTRSIDTANTASKISFQPETGFTYKWKEDNSVLQIFPDTLVYETDYVMTLTGELGDPYGHFIDGNSDGTSGDEFVLNFKTSAFDTDAPYVFSHFPVDGTTNIETMPIINITFNELIDTNTVNSNTIYLQETQSCELVNVTIHCDAASQKSGIQLVPVEDLKYLTDYSVFVSSEISDIVGNKMESNAGFTFQTGNYNQKYSYLDKFDAGVSNWWQPGQSGTKSGQNPDKTYMNAINDTTNPITTSIGAMKLTYSWDMTKSSWILREYTPSGLKSFNRERSMQVYIFGDGSMNKFRFCVDDNTSSEVSPWFVINFVGWRAVTWNMAENECGSWLSGANGSLDGTLKVDSFQLTYNSDSEEAQSEGAIILDDYRLVTFQEVAIDEELAITPMEFNLSQNYPNPFNPTTKINYQIPQSGQVELTIYDMTGKLVKTLVNENQNSGYYTSDWNASNQSSGVYIYSIRVMNGGKLVFSENKKCVLMK